MKEEATGIVVTIETKTKIKKTRPKNKLVCHPPRSQKPMKSRRLSSLAESCDRHKCARAPSLHMVG